MIYPGFVRTERQQTGIVSNLEQAVQKLPFFGSRRANHLDENLLAPRLDPCVRNRENMRFAASLSRTRRLCAMSTCSRKDIKLTATLDKNLIIVRRQTSSSFFAFASRHS